MKKACEKDPPSVFGVPGLLLTGRGLCDFLLLMGRMEGRAVLGG